MKRSEALAPLSRDHHVALAAALRLRRATIADLGRATALFSEFWTRAGARHFEVEEALILPALPPGDPEWDAAVARVRAEHADILARVQALNSAPVGPREADGMITGLRSFPLLDGFRGRPRADLAALRDALLRIGALAAQHPAVAELDCDPLIAGPAGVPIVAARVRLEPPPRERPYQALRSVG